MYAIVRSGGRQEKVALDDVVTVDKLPGEAGSSVTFKAVLVVDGERVISDPAEVSRYQVTADIVGDAACCDVACALASALAFGVVSLGLVSVPMPVIRTWVYRWRWPRRRR